MSSPPRVCRAPKAVTALSTLIVSPREWPDAYARNATSAAVSWTLCWHPGGGEAGRTRGSAPAVVVHLRLAHRRVAAGAGCHYVRRGQIAAMRLSRRRGDRAAPAHA